MILSPRCWLLYFRDSRPPHSDRPATCTEVPLPLRVQYFTWMTSRTHWTWCDYDCSVVMKYKHTVSSGTEGRTSTPVPFHQNMPHSWWTPLLLNQRAVLSSSFQFYWGFIMKSWLFNHGSHDLPQPPELLNAGQLDVPALWWCPSSSSWSVRPLKWARGSL